MRLTLTIFAVLSVVSGQSTSNNEFWSQFEDEDYYNHEWKDLPDVVNLTQMTFYFDVAHHVLQGIERGMYDDNTIELN